MVNTKEKQNQQQQTTPSLRMEVEKPGSMDGVPTGGPCQNRDLQQIQSAGHAGDVVMPGISGTQEEEKEYLDSYFFLPIFQQS